MRETDEEEEPAKPINLLTPNQVAERLGLKPSKVLALAHSGALASINMGARSIRFEPQQVADFIADHRRKSNAERRKLRDGGA